MDGVDWAGIQIGVSATGTDGTVTIAGAAVVTNVCWLGRAGDASETEAGPGAVGPAATADCVVAGDESVESIVEDSVDGNVDGSVDGNVDGSVDGNVDGNVDGTEDGDVEFQGRIDVDAVADDEVDPTSFVGTWATLSTESTT